jgi:hypothetical protein
MNFESIFNDLIEFRKFPNYQLERRIDIFLLQLIPNLLNNHFNDESDWRLVLPEFPVSLSQDNDTFDQMDYLFWNGETLLFIELKTDSRSYKTEQVLRYQNLTKKNWLSMYSFLIRKSKSKKNWRKFADQILYIQKKHPELSLIDDKLNLQNEVRTWNGDLKACSVQIIDYLFIGPESNEFSQLIHDNKLLTLKKCAEYIRTKTEDHESFCLLLDQCM